MEQKALNLIKSIAYASLKGLKASIIKSKKDKANDPKRQRKQKEWLNENRT